MTWTALLFFNNHTKQWTQQTTLKKVITLVFGILPIVTKCQFKILMDLY